MLRRRALERDPRKAQLLRQFGLHYQPQIHVANQKIIGLLRSRPPHRRLMLSGELIAIPEELRLAIPIGEWVLRTACGDVAALVDQALASVQLPGDRLEIEVTGDILLRDAETVRGTLNHRRPLGACVAMDSFGTGIAPLSQLTHFSFDNIKIDRSLVDMDHDGAKHRAIIRAIRALGQALGISTLAEEVETPEQLADVQSEGCNYSEAVPANRLVDLRFTFYAPASPRYGTNKAPHEPKFD